MKKSVITKLLLVLVFLNSCNQNTSDSKTKNVIDSTVFILVAEPKTLFYSSKKGNIVSDFRKMTAYFTTDKPDAYFECIGSLVNKSDKAISFAKLDGQVNVIYKDKVIELNNVNTGSFDNEISTDSLWKPNEVRSFYIKTNGLENIYLNYKPEHMVFTLTIDVKDPVGFKYLKCIYFKDVLNLWDNVKANEK